MRKFIIFLKKRYTTFFWYNYYFQLFFCYHNVFFGSLIFKGKKVLAFKFFLAIKNGLKLREHFNPFLIFLVSMLKLTPTIMLSPLKRSGVVYGVPVPITFRKQITFAVKWVVKLLKDSSRVVSVSRVVDLLTSAIYARGLSFEKKQAMYKTAVLNTHYLRFFK